MDSIRVWLEPDYDHGRTGAWLLDWPGAFTWGETRETALGRVTSAAHRFVDWVTEHGDICAPVPLGLPEVVEEVAAYTLPDGYEINATFSPDELRPSSSQTEAALRRLAFARSDLLAVTDRIRAFESAGGVLSREQRDESAKATGADDGKTPDEILRHLAGAETWFVSRLDPTARYEGPRQETGEYLHGSREFLADGLRRLQAAGAARRADSKGESWTLTKVLRRALYHSLDHLDELDRRLAVAEQRVERVEFRSGPDIDPGALRHLFAATGLRRRARDDNELTRRWLAATPVIISAWDAGELVGFARMLSDEATNAYVSTVAVAPRWQDRGLGTRLMRTLLDGRDSMKLVLESAPGAERFYERLGFEHAPNAFVRQRKSS
jgi:ribosomal protein S18 acetylase RimI-like enzyme